MGVYANSLENALRRASPPAYHISTFIPKAYPGASDQDGNASLMMRLSRYVGYPWQAKVLRADVNHILEHGYAHLLQVLDPDRTIVTVHDLIPLLAWRGRIPGMTYPHRPYLAEYSVGFLRNARYVVTISENTKRDVIEHVRCKPDQVKVIYNGIDEVFGQCGKPSPEVRRQFDLPSQDTRLVMITGNETYKNHKTCLSVLQQLISRHRLPVKLVRLGKPSREWDLLVVRSRLRDSVIDIGPICRSLVPSLYTSVDCLLFPSIYEGFGWPPLEAMACGVPVVTSNVASLPEVVGSAACVRDPFDVDGLSADVATILLDSRYRERRVEEGLAQVRKFSWQAHARALNELYESIR